MAHLKTWSRRKVLQNILTLMPRMTRQKEILFGSLWNLHPLANPRMLLETWTLLIYFPKVLNTGSLAPIGPWCCCCCWSWCWWCCCCCCSNKFELKGLQALYLLSNIGSGLSGFCCCNCGSSFTANRPLPMGLFGCCCCCCLFICCCGCCCCCCCGACCCWELLASSKLWTKWHLGP